MKQGLAKNLLHIQNSNDLTEHDKEYWNEIYTNQFSKELRITTFLLFFAHLEETLFHLYSVNKQNKEELRGNSGVERFKPLLKSLLFVPLGEYKPYQLIRDAQYVRNSLLHVAGRVSISKDSEKLVSIIKKHKEFYILKNDRVQITPSGLLAIQRAVSTLCSDLLKGKTDVELAQT